MRIQSVLANLKRRGFKCLDGENPNDGPSDRMNLSYRFFPAEGCEIVYLHRSEKKKRHHK